MADGVAGLLVRGGLAGEVRIARWQWHYLGIAGKRRSRRDFRFGARRGKSGSSSMSLNVQYCNFVDVSPGARGYGGRGVPLRRARAQQLPAGGRALGP